MSPILLSDRIVLPLLLNLMQLTGEGCEVGVFEGSYSSVILRDWRGKRLYSVDPYRSFSKTAYCDRSNLEQEEFERVYARAQENLGRYKDRSLIVRKTSVDGAKDFPDGSLDFVYLDGNHSFEAVKEDIAAWYPKIKAGGLLAGHDYVEDGITLHGDFGVRKAVAEFSAQYQVGVYQTAEPFPSWMAQKPAAPNCPNIRLEALFQLIENNNLFLTRRISKLESEVELLKVGNLRFFLRQPKKFIQRLLERSHAHDEVVK
jgi:predicted O-methyltransferase YrrM